METVAQLKLTPLILPAINGIIWGSFVWNGFDGEKGVESRMGGVTLAQLQGYVIFPAIMLSVALVPAALLSQTKWSYIGNIWSVLTLLVVLPYLFFYTGGM
jgi:hypothetical protein